MLHLGTNRSYIEKEENNIPSDYLEESRKKLA